MSNPRSASSDVSHRVGILEQTQAAFGQALGTLRDDFHGHRRDFQTFASEVRENFGRRAITPWGTIFSGMSVVAGVVIAIVSLGAKGPLQDLERQRAEIQAHRTVLDDLLDEDYDRPEAEADFAELKREMRREFESAERDAKEHLGLQDDVLQREMRLMDEAIVTRVSHLEEWRRTRENDRFSIRDGDLLRAELTALRARVEEHGALASKVDVVIRDLDRLREDLRSLDK